MLKETKFFIVHDYMKYMHLCGSCKQEPMKSRAPQLHLEYRFYKQLGQAGKLTVATLYSIMIIDGILRPLLQYNVTKEDMVR